MNRFSVTFWIMPTPGAGPRPAAGAGAGCWAFTVPHVAAATLAATISPSTNTRFILVPPRSELSARAHPYLMLPRHRTWIGAGAAAGLAHPPEAFTITRPRDRPFLGHRSRECSPGRGASTTTSSCTTLFGPAGIRARNTQTRGGTHERARTVGGLGPGVGDVPRCIHDDDGAGRPRGWSSLAGRPRGAAGPRGPARPEPRGRRARQLRTRAGTTGAAVQDLRRALRVPDAAAQGRHPPHLRHGAQVGGLVVGGGEHRHHYLPQGDGDRCRRVDTGV